MRTDRNQAGLRELTSAEAKEVAGGATTFILSPTRTAALQPQFVLGRTATFARTPVFFPRNPGLVSVGSACW